jgi:hypothetical protein
MGLVGYQSEFEEWCPDPGLWGEDCAELVEKKGEAIGGWAARW